MLHETSEMRGYHLVATDGEIGHVDDFLIEEGSLTLKCLGALDHVEVGRA